MGVFNSDEMIIEHFRDSFLKAEAMQSKLSKNGLLPAGILNFHGMSGKKTRMLINNLAGIEGLTYAEVGTFTGSTLLSALFGNKIKAVCCDNWSQFNGPREVFQSNVEIYAKGSITESTLSVFEEDFREIIFGSGDWSEIDFYFFDGPHDEQSQYDGIARAYPGLSDRFVLLVDDWNWSGPQSGTERVISDLGLSVLDKKVVLTEDETKNDLNQVINRFNLSDWHNGIAAFACKKNNI